MGDGIWRWQQVAAPELSSYVLALAWVGRGFLVAGTRLGIVVLDFPRNSIATFGLFLP